MTDTQLFDGNSPLLSRQSQQQLVRATQNTRTAPCGLWKHFIEPNLLDLKRNTHTPLIPRKKYAGWRHSHVEKLVSSDASPVDFLAQSPLFTSPLRVPQDLGGTEDGRELWERPSDRVVNGGFWVFTLEMDKPEIAALEQQLAWCRSPDGKSKNSLIGQIDRQLAQYRDYRGVTAIYSGAKSVHISFVFDIRHLDRKLAKTKDKWLGDVDNQVLPGLYRDRWYALVECVGEHFGLEVEFDNQLSSLFQLRRTPGGIRTVEEGHLLDLEPGTQVLQCVLLDLVRSRSSPKATDWFIQPKHASEVLVQAADGTSRSSARVFEEVEADELLENLTDYLQEHWATEYPKPVSLRSTGGLAEVRFKNHPNDRHPGSVIEGPYHRLLIRGQGAPSEPLYLPHHMTLDETLNLLRGHSLTETGGSGSAPSNWWERAFTRHVRCKKDARVQLGILEQTLTGNSRYVWIKSVEGIGKTHTLMHAAPYRRFDRYADTGGNIEPKGFLVIACRSYEQALEKCQAFNQMHAKAGLFHGVALISFNRRYQNVCRSKKIAALSPTDAIDRGYPTVMAAVEAEQPDVFEVVTRSKNEAWQHKGVSRASELDTLRTIIFTVHSLVQHWPTQRQSRTRAWLHPDYTDDLNNDQMKDLCDALMFSEVIYDEVGSDDLVDVYPEAIVNWCETVRRSAKNWATASASDKLTAYRAKAQPSSSAPVSYEECCRIISLRFTTDDCQVVNTDLHPFGNDRDEFGLYTGQNGSRYYIRQQDWWRSLGAKITFLTTEELPTSIAQQLVWNNSADADRPDRFRVYRFDQASRFMGESVPLILDDRAAKDQRGKLKLSSLIGDLREIHPNCKIITNNAPADVSNTLTHQSARGRNDLTRSDLVTIQQYLSPSRYAQLCLLGGYFQINDVIRMHYRDELFQSLGRNLGMRRSDPKPVHIVMISNRLYRDLGVHEYTRGLRYQLLLSRLDPIGQRSAA